MPDETVPPEKPNALQNETPVIETPLPPEYEKGELLSHALQTLPRHYHFGIRPSSMPLSSEDTFSRRITPLGVYYPKDRYRQERQFARAVLELMEKKAYEKKEVPVKVESPPLPEVAKLPEAKLPEAKLPEAKLPEVAKLSEAKLSEVKLPEAKLSEAKLPEVKAKLPEMAKQPEVEAKLPEVKVKLPEVKPPEVVTKEEPKDETKPARLERRVSIVDQIKPPPPHVRPSLRIKNPESLLPLPEDDYREDRNAPRTPANVRGTRSDLHRVAGVSAIPRIGDIDVGREHSCVLRRPPRRSSSVVLREPAGLSRVHASDDVGVPGGYGGGVEYHQTTGRKGGCFGSGMRSREPRSRRRIVRATPRSCGQPLWETRVFLPFRKESRIEIVRYLLEKGAFVDETNKEGNTALHLAILEGRESCVQILLEEANANLFLKNDQFFTPLTLLNSDLCRRFSLSVSSTDFSPEVKMKLRQLFYARHPSFKTIVIHHPDCNLHIPRLTGSQGSNPWEAPPRIDAILKELHEQFPEWEVAYDTNFPPASTSAILRVHSERYVNLLKHLNEEVELSNCVDP